MADFRDELSAFLGGELDFAGLEQRLRLVASHSGETASEILAALEKLYRDGRLPPQLYQLLRSSVQAASGVEDRTRVRPAGQPSSGAPAAEYSPGRPAASSEGPGAPLEDRTQVRPPDEPPAAAPGVSGYGRGEIPPERAQPGLEDRTRVLPAAGRAGEPTEPERLVGADFRESLPSEAEAQGLTGPPIGDTGPARPAPDSAVDAAPPATDTGTGGGTTGTTDSTWGDVADWSTGRAKPLNPNDVLKTRFVLESVLGSGGMGVVFKARDLRKEEAQDRNPYVAVKVLGEDFKSHPEALKALQRESRKAQNLAHPNIVTVYDFDRDGSNVYMTMEYLEGVSLDRCIKARGRQGMPQSEVLVMVNQMGQALAYAHAKGVVHSDFKPSNAFQTPDGTVKVFDFGIARATQHAGRAQGTETLFDAGSLGALTPAYASCEMLEGQPPDPRDDIYALACVTYELLTGRHPFNSTPCHRARDGRLVPAPVKGLSRRQWRALLKGLAFRRQERTPTVEEFLDGIRPKKLSKMVLIGSIAVIALVSVVGVVTIPQLLHSWRIETLVAEFNTGDDEKTEQTLAKLWALEAEDREMVRQKAREPLIGFLERKAEYQIDEAQDRYDYPAAQRYLDEAVKLYPDSATVQDIVKRIDGRRLRLLNDLTTRFNDYLETGRLLPTEDGTDVVSVLAVLRQVDPQNALLEDDRLPVAYADAAARALQQGDVARVDAVLLAGLGRFPQDARLINIKDRLRAERARMERESTVASLGARLAEQVQSLESIADFQRVQPDILQLRDLSPDYPLLADVQTSLQALVDRAQAEAVSQRAWDSGRQRLASLAELLEVSYLQKKRQELETALAEHEQALQDLFATFSRAVADRRLAATVKGSVPALREALVDAGAGPALLRQADASVARAYLDMAREARAGKRWEQAREQVAVGLRQGTGLGVHESLRAELEEIDRAQAAQQELLAEAEREGLERERLARIDELRTGFQAGLRTEPFMAGDGQRLLSTLDQLAAVSPTDTLLVDGRRQVASRLAEEASELGQADRWGEALAFSEQALRVMPGSDILSRSQADLQAGYQRALELEKRKDIAQRKQRVAGLIEQADLGQEWESRLRDELKGLEALLAPTDPYVPGINEQVARVFIDRSRGMREAKRFSEASGLLERGRKYAPGLEDFALEQQAIAAAEKAFERETQERARLARIEGLKRTLSTQAEANDVRRAKVTLQALRDEAPGDLFATETGPEAIGSAYLRLAERKAERDEYDAAIQLAKAGLDIAPDLIPLQGAVSKFEREQKVYELRGVLTKSRQLPVDSIKEKLAELERRDRSAHPGLVDDLAGVLAGRIKKMAPRDYQGAERFLADARQIFPQAQAIAAIKIKPPAKPAKDTRKQVAAMAQSLRSTLAKQRPPLPVAGIKKQLAELERSNKKLHKALVDQLAAALAKRIENMATNNPKAARDLVADARQIFPRSRVIAGINLAPPVRAATKDPCKPGYAGYGRRGRANCKDALDGKTHGPVMVVVPAGTAISEPFAISRYEISIADYNNYCRLSGQCKKKASGKDPRLPVTGISLQEARAYASWLSSKTGFDYRLPTDTEWVHAAEAGGKKTREDHNCELRVGGSLLKGYELLDVKSGSQNGWGLKNYVGNAQEWVQSPSGIKVRGGAHTDSMSKCKITLSKSHDGRADKTTGFRLVRKMSRDSS